MGECPDKECGDNVTRLVFFMKLFGIALIALIGVLGTVLTYSLKADANDKSKVQVIEKNQAVVMDSLEKAVKRQEEIQKNQQSIMLNMQQIQDKIEHESERSRKIDEIILDKLNRIQNTQ